MNNQHDLDTFVEKLQALKQGKQGTVKTFLDVIHKNYKETYVTEILAYLLNPLSNNSKSNLCVKLFLKMVGYDLEATDEVMISTNKYALGDYIDLFVYVPNKVAVVVENKIWSDENGGGQQTQHYYEYCERAYRNVARKYVLLKPDSKKISAYCNEYNGREIYQYVNYSQLIKTLKTVQQGVEDIDYQRILTDFIEHCDRRFTMSEELLDNKTEIYLEYLTMIKDLENNYNEKIRAIKNAISAAMKSAGYSKQVGSRGEIYRFYQKDWYDKDYYLYFEVLYGDDLNKVHCQLTLKDYHYRDTHKKNNQTRFSRILDALVDYPVESTTENYSHYIFKKENILCEKGIKIDEYIESIKAVLLKFAEQAKQMNKIIATVN